MNNSKNTTIVEGVVAYVIGVLIALAFIGGVYFERHNWADEVTGRGFAHQEGGKLIWDK